MHAVDLPFVDHRSADACTHNLLEALNIFFHLLIWFDVLYPLPVFVDIAISTPNPEQKTTAGKFIQINRAHPGQQRTPPVGIEDIRAKTDTSCGYGEGGERHKSAPP